MNMKLPDTNKLRVEIQINFKHVCVTMAETDQMTRMWQYETNRLTYQHTCIWKMKGVHFMYL